MGGNDQAVGTCIAVGSKLDTIARPDQIDLPESPHAPVVPMRNVPSFAPASLTRPVLPGRVSGLGVAAFLMVGVALTVDAQAPSDGFALPKPRYPYTVVKNVMIPMRDGVRLAADVYRPTGAGDRVPVIVMRTPYNKDAYGGSTAPAEFFAGQGFAIISQDVRGRFHSEGDYRVQLTDGRDGYDTIDWAVKQPWSTGKVGTYGCSYLGEVQILLARMRHPNHVAMIPQAAAGGLGSGGGYYSYFGAYDGGTFGLSSGFGWFLGAGAKERGAKVPENVDFNTILRSLPLVDMMRKAGGPKTDWEDYVTSGPGDPYWEEPGYASDDDHFSTPALQVNSWLDYGAEQSLYLFNLMRRNAVNVAARDHQYIVISPTGHCASESASEHTKVGDKDFGDARFGYLAMYVGWFDYWLRGNKSGLDNLPKVRYYVMGKNEWRTAPTWPVPEMRQVSYYLASTTSANTSAGDGLLSLARPRGGTKDTLVYDPGDPFPSRGGTICCTGNPTDQPGVFDQTDLETRPDLLVYSTPVLTKGVTIAGPVRAVLYVSSDAKDTDFTGKLIDVDEKGRSWNVVDGVLRARYREGQSKKVWMERGKIYRVEVNLKSIAYHFAPGHRIRLWISSSDFPRNDRNLNTGGNNWDESTWVRAVNTVHHTTMAPSHLLLPEVP